MTIDDINEFDEGFHELLKTSKECETPEIFDTYNTNYSIDLSDGIIHDLIPNGRYTKVNFEDRLTFIQVALEARLNEFDYQIKSVRKGLCKIMPDSLLKCNLFSKIVLTSKELERLVCGKKTVDVELLKSFTQYNGDLTKQSNRVKWLWEILNEISDDDKVKFVKFCYAKERLPSTKEEYERLQVILKIKPYMDKNKKDVFPKADTCFFSLELPDYTSKNIMKQRIVTAINLDNIGLNGDKVDNINSNINLGR